jgi:osmotically inducible protein OsmC
VETTVMAITRHASAHWEGDLKTGQGKLDTPQSGLLAGTRYGFNTRFGGEKGTNPEELIAAAHAGCFTMALSAKLTEAGHPPESIDTKAEVELGMEGGPTICEIRLATRAKVPGLDATQFRALADDAKQNCPVSKALSAVPISLDAELVG